MVEKNNIAVPAGAAPEEDTLLPGLWQVRDLLATQPQRVDSVFIRRGRKDARTDEIIDLCRGAGVRFQLVEDNVLHRLYPGNSQGVLARLFAEGFHTLESLIDATLASPLPLLLALDQVSDSGNVGTLARTLYARGGGGLLLPRHQGAYLGGAASKSAAGALQKLPVAKVANLAQSLDTLEERGFNLYGGSRGAGAQSIYGFRPLFPAVLVLGSEDKGLRPGIVKRCHTLLEVPLRRDFNSLNVAQAGAVLMGFLGAALEIK